MQGFDPPVHHLGKTGMVGHLDHFESGIAERLGGPAGGQDFDPPLGQETAEIEQAGFVRNGDEGAADGKANLILGHVGSIANRSPTG